MSGMTAVEASAIADTRCPICYVGIGSKCVTRTAAMRPTKTHAARLRAAVGRY